MNATKIWGIIRQIITFGGPMIVGLGLVPEGFMTILVAWLLPIGTSIVGIINKDNLQDAIESLARHTATFVTGSLAFWGVMDNAEFADSLPQLITAIMVTLTSVISKAKAEKISI
jgi:hypothetical protein